MPALDLKSDDGLRRICEEVDALMEEESHAERLRDRVALLSEVRATPPEQRSSVEFLEKVWFDETLGGMKNGKFQRMSEVIADEDFRSWFAGRVAIDLPSRENGESRVDGLEEMRKELLARAKPVLGRRPLLMVNRLLTVLFPEDLIAISFERNLFRVLRALGGKGSERNDHVKANAWICWRLEEVLGSPGETLEALAKRQYLAKLLSNRLKESESDEAEDSSEQAEKESGLVKPDPLSEVWRRFEALVEQESLLFDRADVESLHLGLWADDQRHFAVLAGLSGTGKTQLAWNYGLALVGGESDDTKGRVLPVRVQPGWHDPAPLLGYSNPLAGGAYQRTEFLDFVIRATERPAELHVCVLDEMNLSHPEQYLAPLLSAMEQRGGVVELHRGGSSRHADDEDLADVPERVDVPESLVYPANLVLIGTVNMDETTMGLSDKVLDRAFTLEFWDVDVAKWPGWAGCGLGREDGEEVQGVLGELMTALRPARLHFGWRVIAEVVRYLEARVREGGVLDSNEALDRVIYAKVLPKMRGDDSPRFETALVKCADVLRKRGLKRSEAKVRELDEDRETTGSFRFWR